MVKIRRTDVLELRRVKNDFHFPSTHHSTCAAHRAQDSQGKKEREQCSTIDCGKLQITNPAPILGLVCGIADSSGSDCNALPRAFEPGNTAAAVSWERDPTVGKTASAWH